MRMPPRPRARGSHMSREGQRIGARSRNRRLNRRKCLLRRFPFLLPRSRSVLAAVASAAALPGLLCLGACGSATTEDEGESIQMEGRASYYGGKHNGGTTSGGAIFNPSQMTAAH